MGHSSVETTMIYTHVARKKKLGVRSPVDEMTLQEGGSPEPKGLPPQPGG